MIGINTLQMNEATMIEAVQCLLKEQMPFNTPKVTSVKYEAEHRYDGAFIITLYSSDKKDSAQ